MASIPFAGKPAKLFGHPGRRTQKNDADLAAAEVGVTGLRPELAVKRYSRDLTDARKRVIWPRLLLGAWNAAFSASLTRRVYGEATTARCRFRDGWMTRNFGKPARRSAVVQIILDHGEKARPCRVVWRTENRMGIAFGDLPTEHWAPSARRRSSPTVVRQFEALCSSALGFGCGSLYAATTRGNRIQCQQAHSSPSRIAAKARR